jgi:hypothetical protein
VVDDAVGECECAHAGRLACVGSEIGAGHGRELVWWEGPRAGCHTERTVIVVDVIKLRLRAKTKSFPTL